MAVREKLIRAELETNSINFEPQPPWQDDFTSEVGAFSHILALVKPDQLNTLLGLPHDARTDDVSKHFENFGRIVDVRVMTGRSTWDPSIHPLNPLQVSASSSSKIPGMQKMQCTISMAKTSWEQSER